MLVDMMLDIQHRTDVRCSMLVKLKINLQSPLGSVVQTRHTQRFYCFQDRPVNKRLKATSRPRRVIKSQARRLPPPTVARSRKGSMSTSLLDGRNSCGKALLRKLRRGFVHVSTNCSTLQEPVSPPPKVSSALASGCGLSRIVPAAKSRGMAKNPE